MLDDAAVDMDEEAERSRVGAAGGSLAPGAFGPLGVGADARRPAFRVRHSEDLRFGKWIDLYFIPFELAINVWPGRVDTVSIVCYSVFLSGARDVYGEPGGAHVTGASGAAATSPHAPPRERLSFLNQNIPHTAQGWRFAARFTAAVGLAGAVTLTGLPESGRDTPRGRPAGTAKFKPGPGKRCDTRNGSPDRPRKTPPNSGFPDDPTGNDFYKGYKALPKNFEYDSSRARRTTASTLRRPRRRRRRCSQVPGPGQERRRRGRRSG